MRSAPGQGGEILLRWTSLLLPVGLLFYGLTAFGLLNNVEGMYAEIGREMLAGGSWIIPQLDGLPYIEKPPLLYWALALSMKFFGVGDWAVRLVPALAGLGCLVGTAWLAARQMGWQTARLAFLVLGSCAGFLLIARVALTDALLCAFLNLAWFAAYLALVEARRLWWRLALAFLALALLTKGFVALALFGLVGIFHLLINERTRWRQHLRLIGDPWAWGLFLLLAVPWHWAASRELPEFAWFYFINEHVLRFLGMREPKDYYSGSVFYYLPRLALMLLPWLPLGLWAAWRGRALPRPAGEAALVRFLGVAALAPLAFFSVSSAKANYYAVVCLPPLALLIALFMQRYWHGLRARILLLLPALAMVPALGVFLPLAAEKSPMFSARQLVGEIRDRGPLPVFLYQDFEDCSALPFYLEQAVGSIDVQTADLKFGLGLFPGHPLFPSVATFLTRPEPAYVVALDARLRRPLPEALAARLERLTRIGNATLYRYPGLPSDGVVSMSSVVPGTPGARRPALGTQD